MILLLLLRLNMPLEKFQNCANVFFKSSILNKQSCLNLIVAGEKKPRNSWQVDTV